jgi:NNP family nitrate/nitrite transporter-like MFS transporter
MRWAEFRKAGHWPTLLAAFLYFDVSFCVWYLLGPLGNFVADDLALTATQKGFLVATPLLGGSLFRIVMGVLTDRLGPRRTGLLGIALTFVPLLIGWLFAHSLPTVLVMALLLGTRTRRAGRAVDGQDVHRRGDHQMVPRPDRFAADEEAIERLRTP